LLNKKYENIKYRVSEEQLLEKIEKMNVL